MDGNMFDGMASALVVWLLFAVIGVISFFGGLGYLIWYLFQHLHWV